MMLQRLFWIGGLLALLGGVALAAPPARAEVVPATELVLPAACRLPEGTSLLPDHWLAVWNFDDGAGCVLYVGPATSPASAAQIEAFDLVACEKIGAVDFDGGEAIFSGGYLECPFELRRRRAIDRAWYDHFNVGVAASLEGPGANPILSHPSLSVAVPVRDDGQAMLSWTFTLADGSLGGKASGSWTPTLRDELLIEVCPTEYLECEPGDKRRYAHGGMINKAPIDPTVFNALIDFDLRPTTLYIGYDPSKQATLDGALDSLLIDPAYGKDPTPDIYEGPTPTPRVN